MLTISQEETGLFCKNMVILRSKFLSAHDSQIFRDKHGFLYNVGVGDDKNAKIYCFANDTLNNNKQKPSALVTISKNAINLNKKKKGKNSRKCILI